MECCGALEKENTDTTTRSTEVEIGLCKAKQVVYKTQDGRLNKWCTKHEMVG